MGEPYKPFKLKGHTLPGIRQDKAKAMKNGLEPSAAFQFHEEGHTETKEETIKRMSESLDGGIPEATKMVEAGEIKSDEELQEGPSYKDSPLNQGMESPAPIGDAYGNVYEAPEELTGKERRQQKRADRKARRRGEPLPSEQAAQPMGPPPMAGQPGAPIQPTQQYNPFHPTFNPQGTGAPMYKDLPDNRKGAPYIAPHKYKSSPIQQHPQPTLPGKEVSKKTPRKGKPYGA